MNYEVLDSASGRTKKLDTLAKARKFAQDKWPGCYFDGDPDNGCRKIYVYDSDDDDVLGYINILKDPEPDEDDDGEDDGGEEEDGESESGVPGGARD